MKLIVAAASGALLLSAAAAGQDSSLSATAGVDYSTGTYGQTLDTNMTYVPLIVGYQASSFQAKVTVPYIAIEGPGAVVGGEDGGVVVKSKGTAKTTVATESGLGDVVLQGTYNLYPADPHGLFLELSGKVKLPTADESKGLGTGQADYTAQLDAFFSRGPFTPFGMVGYRFRGSSTVLPLKDGVVASAGLSARASNILSAGVSYDYRQAATATTSAVSEVSPFVIFKPAKPWSIDFYGTIGFSTASPDAGGGLQLKRVFH
jgi:hypothetical protein